VRLAGLLAALLVPAAAGAADCAPAVLHLVRHAEKAEAPGENDPLLSAAGERRALALAAWAEGRPIDAVYATHLRRTQLTAAPLAAARDLELRVLPAGDTARLLARLRSAHCGEQVVVVGHSNTVPEVAQAFGAAPFEIGETEYGRIYTLRPPAVQLQRETFGEDPSSTP
jgi:2,3-bisphosphoglycerate-dependent phosphoglycerate mutase